MINQFYLIKKEMLKALTLFPFLLLSFLLPLLPVSSFSTVMTSEELFRRRRSTKKNDHRDYNPDSKSLEDLVEKARSDTQLRNIKSTKDRYLATVPRSEELLRGRIISKDPKFFIHFFLYNNL